MGMATDPGGQPIKGPARPDLVDGDYNHVAESDLAVADDGSTAHRTWAAAFEDTFSAARQQCFGSLVLHLFSRWITVRDEDNDILAGTYLQGNQVPKLGDKLEIDGVRVVVGNAWEATHGDKEITQVCDLTASPARCGGRFWVLADQGDGDDAVGVEEDNGDVQIRVQGYTRTMISAMADGCCSPVLRRHDLDLRPSKKSSRPKVGIRPWIGPLPKVCPQPIKLADFFAPDWQLAKTKNRRKLRAVTAPGRQPALTTPASSGRQARFLNDSASDGPKGCDVAMGLLVFGYEAQTAVAQETSGVHMYVDPQIVSQTVAPLLRKISRARTGFPRLGSGRVVRVPPPAMPALGTMAGRGQPSKNLQQMGRQGQSSRTGQQDKVSPLLGSNVSAARSDEQRMQPRGRWGHDGVDAYGEGHHRGSSSVGGGRGIGWQGNGGGGRGFSGPTGNFVQGVSGPTYPKRGSFHPNWAGRGGGRRSKPPIPPAASTPEPNTLDVAKEKGEVPGMAADKPVTDKVELVGTTHYPAQCHIYPKVQQVVMQQKDAVKETLKKKILEEPMMNENIEDPDGQGLTRFFSNACYSCGEEGYYSQDCTKRSQEYLGNFPTEEVEFDPLEIEELAKMKESRKKKKYPRKNQISADIDLSHVRCYKCMKFGHHKYMCSGRKPGIQGAKAEAKKPRDWSELICFCCKEAGHFASDCPQRKKARME
ncbi:hypothetical protein D1007_38638 [Hordeum vulgare]|nr:hypothetical protein D1007_38638 [Hordeum vulgare]